MEEERSMGWLVYAGNELVDVVFFATYMEEPDVMEALGLTPHWKVERL